MLHRRFMSLFSLVLAGAVMLAACSPASSTQQPAATSEPGATSMPVTQAPQATQAPGATQAPQATSGPQSSVTLPEIDPGDYSGNVIIAGSSTVFPLTERMVEIFQADGFSGSITIDSIGSGAGIERFCVAGETDIANASRPMRDSEYEQCRSIGREAIEFRVGTDALAVVVSQANDFVTNLTMEELALVFSTDANLWSDVNPAWPAEVIQRFSPGTDSGTYDYFIEAVMEPVYGDDAQVKVLEIPGIQLSEDDNVLVQGVLGSPYAIGYFGYAYYEENTDTLKILDLNGVEASATAVEDGSYPIARPLFIYSTARIMQEKAQVGAFINYYLTYVNDEVVDVGYFPASVAAWDTAKNNWNSAMGMSAVVLLPEVNPAEVTGDIIIAGSSTVFPLTERMAEIFQADGYSGNITIDSIGSGAGIERFCVAGETDIANASRPMRDSEFEQCRSIGREAIEFRVGTDALAVVMSQANDFVTNLTMEELALVFSTDVNLWSDVNPAWPAEVIQRFSPGTDSGTYDYFIEAVMEPVYGDDAQVKILEIPGIQLSEDDNVLVQGVLGSPYAIGYFGYAYYQENAGTLKILDIDGVTPSAAAVEDGSYAIARPLFIYSDATIMRDKPQVASFINYYLTYMDDEISDVGYFAASNSAIDAARQAWLEAAGQ